MQLKNKPVLLSKIVHSKLGTTLILMYSFIQYSFIYIYMMQAEGKHFPATVYAVV